MSGERVERRLAAILAVDVAGYSRLMGEDEEGTLAALRAVRRELGDPKITEHRGRIVKTTGDGLLVEFASVVDAVRCAVEVQRTASTTLANSTRRPSPVILTMRPRCSTILGSPTSRRTARNAASVPSSSSPISRE